MKAVQGSFSGKMGSSSADGTFSLESSADVGFSLRDFLGGGGVDVALEAS